MMNIKFYLCILLTITFLTGCDSNEPKDENISPAIKDIKKCREAISNLEYANEKRIKLNFKVFEFADILVACNREDRAKLLLFKSLNDKLEDKPVDVDGREKNPDS